MSFQKWIRQTAEYSYSSIVSGLGIAGVGLGYVTELVGNLRLFGSTKVANSNQQFDERHYFLVPDRLSEDGYSLVVTRCLPEGVPPINELPKRRLLHLPNANAEPMLRAILVRQAQAEELSKPTDGKSLSDRARELADYIDALDDRVFGGVLLIGGLVALFNPIAGAAIAAKSLLPSLGMLASKYGLRVAEESLSHAEMQRRAKQAEKEVLSQFRGSNTEQIVNELIAITDRALRTTEEEYDPLLAFHALLQTLMNQDQRRNVELASSAILNVFDGALKSAREAQAAGLGPEDLRYLRLLTEFSAANSAPAPNQSI